MTTRSQESTRNTPIKPGQGVDKTDGNLPRSSESEQVVLGTLVTAEDTTLLDSIRDLINDSDFFHKINQRIFSAIILLADRGHRSDPVAVFEVMRDRGFMTEEVRRYITKITEEAPLTPNIRVHATNILEKSKLRNIVLAARETERIVIGHGDKPVDELISVVNTSMTKATGDTRGTTGYREIKDVLHTVMDKISSAMTTDGGIVGVKTMFDDFDKITSGLQESDLIILAARPSMGKTSLAMNIAENASVRDNKRVVVFSMEMSDDQLAMRSISSLGGVSFSNLRNGNLSDSDWNGISAAVSMISASNLIIDDTPSLSPHDLRARAIKISKEKGKIDMIVVDYLQLMQIPGYKQNRSEEISEISRSLKALAKELEVPIIALSQLNRSVETRPNKRPINSDLRESGAIEQDADLIVFIYRDEVYNSDSPHKGLAEIIISKQRNGPLGTVMLGFSGKHTRFENLPDGFTGSDGGHQGYD